MATLNVWKRISALERLVPKLEDRVWELENEIKRLKDGVTDQQLMYVSKNRSCTAGFGQSFNDNFKSVPIQKAVLKIIDHLGIEFAYQAGTPEDVVVRKIEMPDKKKRNG